MRLTANVLFLGQLALAPIGAKFSPDYYARSSETVLQWAWTSGVWITLSSILVSIGLLVIAVRAGKARTWAAFTVSAVLSLAWAVYPMAYSLLGDILFWRFP